MNQQSTLCLVPGERSGAISLSTGAASPHEHCGTNSLSASSHMLHRAQVPCQSQPPPHLSPQRYPQAPRKPVVVPHLHLRSRSPLPLPQPPHHLPLPRLPHRQARPPPPQPPQERARTAARSVVVPAVRVGMALLLERGHLLLTRPAEVAVAVASVEHARGATRASKHPAPRCKSAPKPVVKRHRARRSTFNWFPRNRSRRWVGASRARRRVGMDHSVTVGATMETGVVVVGKVSFFVARATSVCLFPVHCVF